MNDLITWAAQHNTIFIQVVFSIVLFLILIYVYRLFFVNSPSAAEGDSVAEFSQVNEKLDRLIDQQKSSGIQVIEKVVPAAPAEAGVVTDVPAASTAPAANPAELDQVNAENAKLKAQLNELEKKVFELSPVAGSEGAAKVDESRIVELNKKVEELQSRLSEYDIIADDIAELSQLRSENAELKKKIENGGGDSSGSSSGDSGGSSNGEATEIPSSEAVGTSGVSDTSEPVQTAEAPVNSEAVSTEVASNEAAPVEAVTAVAEIEATAPVEAAASSGDVPGFDPETSALLDSLVAETDALNAANATEAPTEAATETSEEPKFTLDQNIPENEKNLINEFEKSIQKGS